MMRKWLTYYYSFSGPAPFLVTLGAIIALAAFPGDTWPIIAAAFFLNVQSAELMNQVPSQEISYLTLSLPFSRRQLWDGYWIFMSVWTAVMMLASLSSLLLPDNGSNYLVVRLIIVLLYYQIAPIAFCSPEKHRKHLFIVSGLLIVIPSWLIIVYLFVTEVMLPAVPIILLGIGILFWLLEKSRFINGEVDLDV